MAEQQQRQIIQNRQGQFLLQAFQGGANAETIPRKVREEYEEAGGALKPGQPVLVTVVKGRITKMVPVDHIELTPAPPPPRRPPAPVMPEPLARGVNTSVPHRPGRAAPAVTDGFVNPYAFVPFIDPAVSRPDGMGQGAPVGHELWHDDRYSGTISVRFETVTPLLTSQVTRSIATNVDGKNVEMPVFSIRRDAAGRPVVAGASVKGAVRTLVEQITGSRLGVFDPRRPIVRRMVTKEALEVELAEVLEHIEGKSLVLRPSMELPARDHQPVSTVSAPNFNVGEYKDGDEVQGWLQLTRHPPKGGQTWYDFWRVVTPLESPTDDACGTPDGVDPGGQLTPVAGVPLLRVRGVLHATDKTFGSKHDERLCVRGLWEGSGWRYAGADADITLEGDGYDDVVMAWRTVIDSFGEGRYPGGAVRPTYAQPGEKADRWKALHPGRTVFITAMSAHGGVQLLPGMITRKRYPSTPGELLDHSLHPCTDWHEMSPADRMFGWVHAGADGGHERGAHVAYRGQCAFGPVTCMSESEGPRDNGRDYWTLPALNQPKPQQSRFYLRDADGPPLDGLEKEDGYRHQDRLAGHKVYPTHQVPPDHWTLPEGGWPIGNAGKTVNEPRRRGNRYQSWLAPQDTSAKVTAAIADWVAPGSTFTFTVHVINLTQLELGALLWALDLGNSPRAASPRCLKLGRGRPLGFGAVTMGIDRDATVLRTGQQQRERYGSLGAMTASDSATLIDGSLQTFEKWLAAAAPHVLDAVISAAVGFTQPVIYPRLKPSGEPAGEPRPTLESYQWFVANEQGRAKDRTGQNGKGTPSRAALPLLAGERAPLLPYWPVSNFTVRQNGKH